ncbi:MAG TPA: nuclear transport factor 2 family protein [Steroidobacteraceae bacterium]|jgi:ketosteroid isomerase-like protein|nr:nuclear transport factor 2 family protein [Steroidobacteraceae bacterium]
MPKHTLLIVMVAAGLIAGCASSPGTRSHARRTAASGAAPNPTGAASAQLAAATNQVAAAETALAKSMADRNFETFLALLSPDAIFFNGNSVEHGRAQIAQLWAPYFAGPRAPFSWTPDHVEVLPDGKLALSTGPLMQDGRIVGRFNSVWRLEAPNVWHIVFDKGEAVCSAPTPAGEPGGTGVTLPPQ